MRISDRSSDVCSSDLFDGLGRTLTTVPANVNVHKTLRRILEQKAEMFRSGEGFDWATGEALAFGGLLSEGYGVRLSRSEEHTSELQSLMRISYAVFCLKKKIKTKRHTQ